MRERGHAIVALVLLSPITAELLTASSPPLEFFFPLTFAFLVALYGSGVLLVRELTIRWNKSWMSVLLLGAAYGVIEEGVLVKSFFNPNWIDLGALAGFGRWGGVNWVWSIWLTVFHGIVSIAVPIILINLLYPQLKRERLTSDLQLLTLGIIFIFIVLPGQTLFVYSPETYLQLLALMMAVVLFFAAREMPRDWPRMKSKAPTLTPQYFYAFGLLFMFFAFFIVYALPERDTPPSTVVTLFFLLCLGIFLAITNTAGRRFNEKALFSLVAGILSPLIALSFIHEASNQLGMSLVGIGYAAFLLFLMLKVWWEAPEATAGKVPLRAGKEL